MIKNCATSNATVLQEYFTLLSGQKRGHNESTRPISDKKTETRQFFDNNFIIFLLNIY